MSKKRLNSPNDEPLRVVINDACCLIDLHKGELIDLMLRLPYRFVVAWPVRENELLDFNVRDWKRMQAAGLEVVDLDSNQVRRAFDLRATHRKLTFEDCLSLVLAQDMIEPILLTSDAGLRHVATSAGQKVHGVLWVTEQIFSHNLCAPARLLRCVQSWVDDPLVRLPNDLLQAQIRAFTRK